MSALATLLAKLFGHGDDDFPSWLLTVRINILWFIAAAACSLLLALRRARLRKSWRDVAVAALLTALGAGLRFGLAKSNLLDQGGIPYSRLLLGYRGNFAAAQLYSLIYLFTGRDIEHAIALDRLFGTLTIPALYLLCRQLHPRSIWFAAIAAGIVACSPLHILFSASDALSIFSSFLATLSFVFLLAAASTSGAESLMQLLAAALGLALLTQVRYENVLFLLPAAVFVWVARDRFPLRPALPAVVLGVALLAAYSVFSIRAGLSFHSHMRFRDSYVIVMKELVGNPFAGIHFLLLGAALVLLRRSLGFAAGALALWAVALLLTMATTESAHDAARVFSNWLIPLILCAAYGYYLLASEYRQNGAVVVAILLAWQLTRPLAFLPALSTQYAEMAEEVAFRSLLGSLPPSISLLVVPDDELLRRSQGSTIETMNKYSLTAAAQSLRLLGVTEFLEHSSGAECRHGECAFYSGLPCEGDRLDSLTGQECRAMLAHHTAGVLDERAVVAARFADCSVAVGGRRRDRCHPAEHPFRLYAIH